MSRMAVLVNTELKHMLYYLKVENLAQMTR